MKTYSIKQIILVAGLAAILVSCNTSKHYQRGAVSTDGLFGNTATSDSANLAEKPWRELFTETHLQKLIQEGLNNNLDLQLAVQKVMEAEAYFSQSKAALLPSVSANGKGIYTRNPESIYPDGPREVSTYQLSADASWEVDLWGKLRSSKRAAYTNLLASDAGQKAVQTRLISNIASAYYALVGLDAKLAITQLTVKNNIDLVETLKVLKESGRVTGAAIVQSEAARYAAEVTIPDLEQQIRETENALCLLLGRVPGTVERGKIEEQTLSAALQTGIPAQMLDNRPDVMQAEYALMSAYEITGNARAYFYPALTLTASAGFAAADLDKLIDPISFAANVIGGLAQPIFNKKINTTRLKVSQAQQEEALISFRSTLLKAGQEVHNTLGSYESAVQKIALRQLQLDALIKSVDYTKELLTYGSATYTEVLNAQTSLLSAQLSSVNDQLQQLNAVVTLYRALGGGWE
ncbi:MAG: TolC family protein [Prolixibacteraceae bacterium]|nr:TolC family protein [Prolixibacteraceae bacterium]